MSDQQGADGEESKRIARAENEKVKQTYRQYKVQKYNWLLAVSIISVMALIFLWCYYIMVLNPDTSSNTTLEAMLAEWLVMPHLLMFSFATVFAYLAWFYLLDWCALTAGILYAVAFAMLPSWGYDTIFQMVVCFVVYGKTAKAK